VIKIKEYDQKRAKRLLYIIPVAIAVITILLATLEKSKVMDRIFMVGYEGPMKILPEITIIDDRGLEAEFLSEERRDMIVKDVEVYSEEEEESDDEEAISTTADKQEPEDPIYDDVEGLDLIRTYATHAPVPYREDYVIRKMVTPEYPADALERGLEGYVLVEVYVNDKGSVEGAWIRKVKGTQSFERATLEAVKQFEFKPITDRGNPISFWISFLIRFELN
jgi:TonB family protein